MPDLSSHKGSGLQAIYAAMMILGNKRTGASPTRLRAAMEAGWHTTLPKREAGGHKMGISPRRAVFLNSTAKTQRNFGHGAVGSDWLAICCYYVTQFAQSKKTT